MCFSTFFEILPRVFFLAGGGLASALSVVEVAVLELLLVMYCKHSRDILSLIDVMLRLGIYRIAGYFSEVQIFPNGEI